MTATALTIWRRLAQTAFPRLPRHKVRLSHRPRVLPISCTKQVTMSMEEHTTSFSESGRQGSDGGLTDVLKDDGESLQAFASPGQSSARRRKPEEKRHNSQLSLSERITESEAAAAVASTATEEEDEGAVSREEGVAWWACYEDSLHICIFKDAGPFLPKAIVKYNAS